MKTTTIIRRLSSTDVADKSGHGSEPPMPNSGKLTDSIEVFFDGREVRQKFIDVNTNKTFTLRMTDYATSKTHHRVAPIGKFRSTYDLGVGDQIILEKIEKTGVSFYLIDYLKKSSVIALYGENGNKGLVNEKKLAAIMEPRIKNGTASEPTPGEYHIKGKYKKTRGEFVLYCVANKMEIKFDGALVAIKGKKQYELDFSKTEIIFKELPDWEIEEDKPKLLSKYSTEDYMNDDNKIKNEIDGNDLLGNKTHYTPAPVVKEPLKSTKNGKVYPRKKSVSVGALKRADNQCEFNCSHRSFIRKNSNVKYMEPHHLIPLQFHEDFDWSLDVEANVVSLCSECHNRIHYGDGANIIKKLWKLRKDELKGAKIPITEKNLLKYYGY